jgi:hypothetical protein
MARNTQNKRSSVAGNIPDAAALEVGGLAINFVDRLIYTKNGASAVIRLTSRVTVSETEPVDPSAGDEYFNATTQQYFIYADTGTGLAWTEVSPPEDLSGYLPLAGATMTGQITLPGGGGVNDAVTVGEAQVLIGATVADYMPLAGGTMAGQITLPGGGTGNQAVTKTELDAAIAGVGAPDLDDYLLKAGGVMTGQLSLPGGGTGNQAVSATELGAALLVHKAEPDPHTNYALLTELTAHAAAGGVQHPAATTSVAGFMPAADKVKVDALVFASEAEALAGVDNTKYMNALRTKQALDAALTPNTQTFLANDTWTKPSGGFRLAKVQIWGAGGSGANAASSSNKAAGGGGGGAYREEWYSLSALTATVSVTIGAGGTAKVAGVRADGEAGGNSTFGSYITAYGGGAGAVSTNNSTNSATGGGGGGWAAKGAVGTINNDSVTAVQATISVPGARSSLVDQLDRHNASWGGGAGGGAAISGGNLFLCQTGGDAVYGGAGGGAACADSGQGNGGTGINGGNGGAGRNATAGVAGSVPGGGGGATFNSGFASGAGATGKCIVTCY